MKKIVSFLLCSVLLFTVCFVAFADGHSQIHPTISFSVGIGGGDASIGFTSETSIPASAKGEVVIKQ